MSTSGDESRDVVEATNGGAAKGNATALEDKVRTPDKDGIINPKYDIGVIMFGTDADELLRGPNGEEYPSKEDLNTLRRVKGRISPFIYTIAFIELCERFAYYGTTAVCMSFLLQSVLQTRHGLNMNSCQFHSAASSGWVHHGRCWDVWSTWCPR